MRYSRRPTAALLTIVLCAPLALAAEVSAQPASPAAQDTTQKADELFLKGKALLKDGKKTEALAAYREAYKLRKSYDVAGNLGSLELELGQHRDAAEHLGYALSHYAATGTTKEQLDRAKQRFEAAKKEVGTLRIAVNVQGAEVLVDGASVGRAPLGEDAYVTPGKHKVEARLAGHETGETSIDIVKGAALDVKLELAPVKAVGPSATSTAAPSATTAPSATPTVTPRSKVPAFVMGGAGVASLIAGGVLIGVAHGNHDDIARQSAAILAGGKGCPADPRCATLEGAARTGDTLSRAGAGVLIGGALLGGLALTYWLWPSEPSKKSSIRLAPVASMQDGGFVMSGDF